MNDGFGGIAGGKNGGNAEVIDKIGRTFGGHPFGGSSAPLGVADLGVPFPGSDRGRGQWRIRPLWLYRALWSPPPEKSQDTFVRQGTEKNSKGNNRHNIGVGHRPLKKIFSQTPLKSSWGRKAPPPHPRHNHYLRFNLRINHSPPPRTI